MSKKIHTVIYIALSLVLACSIAFNVFLMLDVDKKDESIGVYLSEAEIRKNEIEQAKNRIGELDRMILDDLNKIEEMKATIKVLEDNEDEEYLLGKIAEIEAELEEKIAEQELLKQQIDELEKVYLVDINRQIAILDEIEEMLANPPKKLTTKEIDTGEVDEDGNPITEEITEESDAIVSLYYLDIENGYRYSYNSDTVLGSASCVKLPYALSLLQAASAEMAAHEDDPEYVPMGFDEIFTYTEDKKEEGTGIIKNDPDGTEYTYLELIDYVVRHSDNVAFKALRDKYGYSYINTYVSQNRIKSMQKHGIWKLNAIDGADVMYDVYEFINNDEYYGEFLEESMLNGSHRVMTVHGVYPKKAAHKYGWDDDSYHDMTIVYGDKPYIIVFMSDLHQGGNEVNTYIQTLTRKINMLHDNFYKEQQARGM
ncbi:MAG: serine hydrolase [Clostridia bacterium]|nr:serine hydrolase [Clostridia bacterium]